MMSSYMQDMGINSEQFENACHQANAKMNNKFRQALFEQVIIKLTN